MHMIRMRRANSGKKNVAHIRLAFRTFCSLFNFMCILRCSAIGSYCRLFFHLFRLCHQLAVYRTHTHTFRPTIDAKMQKS